MTRLLRREFAKTFRALRIRNYRLYFIGQVVSFSGTWMQIVGQMWLVLQLTGSGVALGVITALQFLPVLVAGPWGGVLADRLDKRRVLFFTQSVSAVLALILGLLVVFGAAELWHVYVLAFLLGCVTVIDNPARQAFTIEMVGEVDLPNAVGLNTTIFTTARIVGPAIAGVVIGIFGVGPCFLINAATFGAVILGLGRMDTAELQPSEPLPRAKGQLLEGLRYVWANEQLRTPLLLMAVVGTLAFNFRIVLPLLAEREFGGGPETYGALSAVLGIGTMLGALVAANRARPNERLLGSSAGFFGLLMVVSAMAPTLVTEMVALALTGAVSMIFLATANTTLQLNSSTAMRGRVMALYAVVFLGSTPIGSPIAGWVAEAAGPRAVLAGAGAITALASGTILWRSNVRRSRRTAAEGGVEALWIETVEEEDLAG